MLRRLLALFVTAVLAGPVAAGDPTPNKKTFVVAATTGAYCDPLCVVIHPSATRVTFQVFGDDSYYGRVLYHDTATTTASETLTPAKTITTAATSGQVTIEMKAVNRATAFQVVVTAESSDPPAGGRRRQPEPDAEAFEDRATDALVRGLETALNSLTDDDADARRLREQFQELKARRRPRPPANPAPPLPFPPVVRPVPPVGRPLPVPPAARPSAGVERSPVAAEQLHVLLVIDTHADGIGANMVKNEQHLRAALAAGLGSHPAYRPPTVLSGTRATPENVRKYFRDLPRAGLAHEAVLVVYTGHGGMIRNEHVFTMRYGDMNRSEVRRLLDGSGAGLGVLFSDCCANRMQSLAADEIPPTAVLVRPQARAVGAAGPSPFADLFLYHRGRVDVTACRPGEVSWCDSVNGGHLTKSFVDAAAGVGPVGYEPPPAFTSWGVFWARVRGNTLRYPNRVVPVANTPLNK